MFKDPSLTKLYSYIFTINEILFSLDKKTHLDYAKLDNNSPDYDAEYEKSFRRKELHALYLLDEMVYIKTGCEGESVNLLNEIEAAVFSPAFYRDLIFMESPFCFIKKIAKLCDTIEGSVTYIKKNVSAAEYTDMVVKFDYLSPPDSKEKFLADLKEVTAFLRKKGNILEGF
jgi:hypothetical protein